MNETLIREKLAENTKQDGNCLVWTGPTHQDNGGRISIDNVRHPVHRLVYEMERGELGHGNRAVRHSCGNILCVTPAHLYLGNEVKRKPTGRRTNAERDAEMRNMKYVDRVYWGGRTLVHTSLRCDRMKDPYDVSKVALFQEGDRQFIIVKDQGNLTVTKCETCPPIQSEAWRDRAACAATSQDFLTQVQDERQYLIDTFCNVCPVRVECYNYAAEDARTDDGIWGGVVFTPALRKQLG